MTQHTNLRRKLAEALPHPATLIGITLALICAVALDLAQGWREHQALKGAADAAALAALSFVDQPRQATAQAIRTAGLNGRTLEASDVRFGSLSAKGAFVAAQGAPSAIEVTLRHRPDAGLAQLLRIDARPARATSVAMRFCSDPANCPSVLAR